jgi:hypothetical protein
MKDGGSVHYDVLNHSECGFHTVIHDHSLTAKENGFFHTVQRQMKLTNLLHMNGYGL